MRPGIDPYKTFEHMVAGDGFAGHPANQCRAQSDDDRKTLHQLDHQRGAKDDQRNADGQAQNQQQHIAACCSSHGDHIVQTHDQIGEQNGANGSHHALPGHAAGILFFIFALEQAHANPQQQQATDHLDEWQLHQLGCHHRQGNTQHHGGTRAEQHRFFLLCGGQRACCEGDDDGVVARQDDVDPDDLEQADPEIGTEHGIHGKYS